MSRKFPLYAFDESLLYFLLVKPTPITRARATHCPGKYYFVALMDLSILRRSLIFIGWIQIEMNGRSIKQFYFITINSNIAFEVVCE